MAFVGCLLYLLSFNGIDVNFIIIFALLGAVALSLLLLFVYACVKFPLLYDCLVNFSRLIKEFDREIKDEESKNPPEVNKQLNDEKQSMVSVFRT